ncbi:ComF family protein, partial [Streptomyces sp. NPDC059233]
MRGWWQELAGLVLPDDCAGCGAARVLLCERCREALSGAGAGLVRPSPAPEGLPVVHAAAVYEGPVRAVLLAHKERGALPLAGALGRALAAAVLAGAEGPGEGLG